MKIKDEVVVVANREAGYSYDRWSRIDKWAWNKGIKLWTLGRRKEEVDFTEAESIIAKLADSIIATLPREIRLIITYGGDGTNFYVLNALAKYGRLELVINAPIGGGTMRRLPRLARWVGEPVANAEKALHLYAQYHYSWDWPPPSLPLLLVEWGKQSYVGFTCLTGAIVKLMQEYSRFQTTPVFAFLMSAAALGAGLAGWPSYFTRLYDQFEGVVTVGSRELAERQFIGTLADVMDTTIFHISPYRQKRGEGQFFHCLAYAIGYEELVRNFPRLAIGKPPQLPRYFNELVKKLIVESAKPLDFTIDGEFFLLPPNTKLTISLGPSVRVLVNPTLSIPLVSPLLSELNARMEALLGLRRFFLPKPKK